MSRQDINIGAAPNDGTGDNLRTGGDKINQNFIELYRDKADTQAVNDSLALKADTQAVNQALSTKADSETVSQSFQQVGNSLNNKVDKVQGKGLSTNDYTTADKTKVDGIENNAQRNPDQVTQVEAEAGTGTGIRSWPVVRVWQAIQAWWQSSAMKTKLDTLPAAPAVDGKSYVLKDRAWALSSGGANFRNKIINGKMEIAQRGLSFTLNSSTLTYTADRWGVGWITGGAVGQANIASGQLPLARNALVISITSASAPSGNQTYNCQQRIEGLNVGDLLWGTSSAKSVTLSFKVQSSITGVFSGAIQNSAQNRSYPFTYTISQANTPTYISITIPGDTQGTWLTNTSTGLIVAFDLGGAGTMRGSAAAWASSGAFGVTGSVSLVATASASWALSEVQFEVGDQATPFEHRPYGLELALCRRYFQKTYNINVDPGTSGDFQGALFHSVEATCGYASVYWSFSESMRSTPTVIAFSPSNGSVGFASVDGAARPIGATNAGTAGVGFRLSASQSTVDQFMTVHATANAEL